MLFQKLWPVLYKRDKLDLRLTKILIALNAKNGQREK